MIYDDGRAEAIEVHEKDKVGWFFKLFLLMFIPDMFGEDWKP